MNLRIAAAALLLAYCVAALAGEKRGAEDKEEGKTSPKVQKEEGKKRDEKEEDPEKEWPPNFADLLGLQPKSIEECWLPPTAGPFATFTAPITEKDHIVLQPFFFYNWTRGTFDDNSHYHSLPKGDRKETAVESLFMQYAPVDNFEVDAQLFINEVRTRQAGKSASASGLADTLLMARYNLLHQTNAWWCPETSLLTQIKLPTGKHDHADPNLLGIDLMGTGSTDLTIGLDLTKCYKPLILHGDLWYSWPIETQIDGVPTRYGDYLQWNAGVEIPFWKDKFAYMLEFNGLHQANTRERGVAVGGNRVNNVSMGTGIEYIPRDDLQFLIGYQRTLWGTNVDANDTFGITLVWCFGLPNKKK